MKAENPHLALDRIALIFIVALIGLGITYLELNAGQLYERLSGNLGRNTNQAAPAPESKPATEPAKQAAAPAATTAPAATPAPAPAAATAPAAKTATTVSFVHVRAGKSTSTSILFNLDGGAVVTLRDDSDPTWQGVTYNGQDGYIYKSYLQY